jgi:hypothetical protein
LPLEFGLQSLSFAFFSNFLLLCRWTSSWPGFFPKLLEIVAFFNIVWCELQLFVGLVEVFLKDEAFAWRGSPPVPEGFDSRKKPSL